MAKYNKPTDSSPENGTAQDSPPPADPSPEKAPTDGAVEILNKLNAKDIVKRSALVYRKDKDGKLEDGEPRMLYRIFGVARGTKTGESNFGIWTSFLGSFEAVRFSDHARFLAPQAFLQGASEGLLLDALTTAQKEDPTATLSFAFDIGVKPSQKWIETDAGNTYEYTIKTVFETQQHDPLRTLRESAMKSLPALPPPTGK